MRFTARCKVTTGLGTRPGDNKAWETVTTTTAGNQRLPRWSALCTGDSLSLGVTRGCGFPAITVAAARGPSHSVISPGANYFAVLLGAIAGGFLGRSIGDRRAHGLRLQAQMAIRQLKLESRFVTASAAPAARPAAPAPVSPAVTAPAAVPAPVTVAPPVPPAVRAPAPAPAPAAAPSPSPVRSEAPVAIAPAGPRLVDESSGPALPPLSARPF